MKAADLVKALKPLEGKTANITVVVGGSTWQHTQRVVRVRVLPPRERVEGAGNVILESGETGPDGAPGGITMWAKNVDSAEWVNGRLVLCGTSRLGFATVIIVPEEGEGDANQERV